MDKGDAIYSKTFGEDEDDALNDVSSVIFEIHSILINQYTQIAINPGQSHIVTTSDAGEVSVLYISSGDVNEMRTKHSSVGVIDLKCYTSIC